MKISDRKNVFVWIIVVLLILLGVTIGGWINASTQLSKLSAVDSQFAQYEDSLAVCEKIDSLDNQNLCVKRLSELSKLLSKYEEKLKNIKAHAQL